MIHIGSANYYKEVRSRLDGCDAILFEGVRSFRVSVLTMSYKLVARRKRLGLVTQRDALRLKECRAKLIHADVSGKEFVDDWDRIPWHWRLFFWMAPIYGIYRYLTATRESIAKGSGTDDLESREDILRGEALPEFEDAIIRNRDLRLIRTIEEVLNGNQPFEVIAIVYGAGHMRAVTGLLMRKYRYQVVQSEWLTVFAHE